MSVISGIVEMYRALPGESFFYGKLLINTICYYSRLSNKLLLEPIRIISIQFLLQETDYDRHGVTILLTFEQSPYLNIYKREIWKKKRDSSHFLQLLLLLLQFVLQQRKYNSVFVDLCYTSIKSRHICIPSFAKYYQNLNMGENKETFFWIERILH